MDATPLFDVSTALEILGYHHGDPPFLGNWKQIHWMNTPGPIYCAETDNATPAPLAAPNHVGEDKGGFQVIYRQPANLFDLHQVVEAANCDPFDGYGINGDLHWSYETIKGWWSGPHREIEQEVRQLYKIYLTQGDHVQGAGLQRWVDYFQEGLYQYLQAYAFFLDTGRLPLANERLPDL